MSRDLGKELVTILGLEGKKVTAISIKCDAQKPNPIAEVTFALVDQEIAAVAEIVREYELVSVADEPVVVNGDGLGVHINERMQKILDDLAERYRGGLF